MSEGHGSGLGNAIIYRGDDPQDYIEELERELAKIKRHADLMAYGKGTAAINAMVAYRAAYPKED